MTSAETLFTLILHQGLRENDIVYVTLDASEASEKVQHKWETEYGVYEPSLRRRAPPIAEDGTIVEIQPMTFACPNNYTSIQLSRLISERLMIPLYCINTLSYIPAEIVIKEKEMKEKARKQREAKKKGIKKRPSKQAVQKQYDPLEDTLSQLTSFHLPNSINSSAASLRASISRPTTRQENRLQSLSTSSNSNTSLPPLSPFSARDRQTSETSSSTTSYSRQTSKSSVSYSNQTTPAHSRNPSTVTHFRSPSGSVTVNSPSSAVTAPISSRQRSSIVSPRRKELTPSSSNKTSTTDLHAATKRTPPTTMRTIARSSVDGWLNQPTVPIPIAPIEPFSEYVNHKRSSTGLNLFVKQVMKQKVETGHVE